MKYLSLLFISICLISTPVHARSKFTQKRYDKIEIGMTLAEVTKSLGKKVAVLPKMNGTSATNYLASTYLEQADLDSEKEFMILTYTHGKMAFWTSRVIMTTASIVLSEGIVVLKMLKST